MVINRKLIKDRVRELVDDNKLRQAVNYLCQYFDSEDDDYRNEASIMKMQISELEKKLRIGMVTHEEANIQKAKITLAILELVCGVCSLNE